MPEANTEDQGFSSIFFHFPTLSKKPNCKDKILNYKFWTCYGKHRRRAIAVKQARRLLRRSSVQTLSNTDTF